MSHAAKSMMFCGIYLVGIGAVCLFIPEMAYFFLQIKSSPDLFVRMLGMVFLIFSSLYIRSAMKDKGEEFFFKITAQERCTIPIFLTSFYLLGYGNILLVIFGIFDAALGVWTLLALRKDAK